ncbi:anti-sigma factor [Paenibacillus harenae]|uniref:anti-sigma factor n=1 Tax=Paenibacillus harenae TaxID=306543 RepID=UPI002790A4B3|nr:anti-sigma factor [Paenibacillus harenae]MDQ0064055.1 hypothetical protein [Paenibacillus harenae]
MAEGRNTYQRNKDSVRVDCGHGYSEQDWIDYAMNKPGVIRQKTMEENLASCGQCAAVYREWAFLLAVGDSRDWTESVSAPLAAGHLASLEKEIRRIGRMRRLRKWAIAGALPVAAALLLFALLRGTPPNEALTPFEAYVERQEPAALHVVMAPDTSRYRIMAPGGRTENGYLWLSGDSSEAFLLLDHLTGLSNSVYQAWAVKGDRSDSLGLVKLKGTRGHLHVRAYTDMLLGADIISLSAEPMGGSAQPTSRQIELLLLNRR